MASGHSKSREWSDEEMMDLIHLYEAQEFLWNVKHKCYRNREKKMNAFDEIAKKFNCDGNEVQRKIHNLRNQVSHEMQKIKKSKSGDGEEDRYESKWKFFSALKFKMPSFTPTQTTSNIVTATQDSLGVLEDNPSQMKRKTPTGEPSPRKKKIPTKKKSQSPEDDILQEAIAIMKKPKDDFDRFGDYVAMELKNIKSDYFRGQLKSAIRKAIVQYSDLDQTTFFNSVPSTSTSAASTPTGDFGDQSPLLQYCDNNATPQQYYNSLYDTSPQ